MSYYITGIQYFDRTSNFNPQGAMLSVICDAVSDLPTAAAMETDTGYTPIIGTTAQVIADSSTYILNSGGTWVLQEGEIFQNVYTKTETDTLLAGKQDTLTITGTASAGSTDIITAGGVWKETYMQHTLGFAANSYDDYNTPGRWLVSASASYTIARRPAYFASSAQQAACTLEVVQVYESGSSYRLLQRLWISGARYFMRGYLSTRTPDPWFDWYMYEGTVQGYLP